MDKKEIRAQPKKRCPCVIKEQCLRSGCNQPVPCNDYKEWLREYRATYYSK